MGNLGRVVLPLQSGYDDSIIAGADPEWLMVGATIDLGVVPVASADFTTPSGHLIRKGHPYLLRGQCMCRIGGSGAAAADSYSLTNTPTGGTYTLSVTRGDVTTTTSALAYNANAAAIQAALVALSNVGAGNATVTGTGPYAVAFALSLGQATLSGDGSLMTGSGAQPAVSVTVTQSGRVGRFGPFDPSATSTGRDALHRGDCGLIERTIDFGGSLGLGLREDYHVGLVVGGHVWKGMVIQAGTGSHSLAAGPTQAELEAAMPTLVLVSRSY